LDNKLLLTVIRWLVILAMPFFLGMGTIRLIIAWDYPRFEYGRIPPDQFGFTPEERLALAHGTLAYLRQPEPAEEVIFLLEDMRLPDSDQPLYNEREISHMLDVKIVADAMKRVVWISAVIVVFGLAFLLMRAETRLYGWRTLMYAGLATVIALAAIAVFIFVGWNTFFVQFHQLLFPAGTWTFAYTDSLIRLFPERFWFDIGVLISVGTLLQGILIALAGYFLSRLG
jgi:integral membrane protein (TIGR01906 family)